MSELPTHWRGRRILSGHRYPRVHWPEHELAHDSDGFVYIHRVVANEKFGDIPDGYHVHHRDGNKWNWKPDNLELLSAKEHARLHSPEPVEKICLACGNSFQAGMKSSRKYCSPECSSKSQERINWPDTSYLKKKSEEIGFSALARELGVSDNAVRKRIQNHPGGIA